MEWGIPTLIETDTLEASAALCQELKIGHFFVERHSKSVWDLFYCSFGRKDGFV